MTNKGARISLITKKDKVKYDELSSFSIGVMFENRSAEVIEFNISKTSVFINNERSFAWNMAVQNGTLFNFKLREGKSRKIEWPMGNALFSNVGKYNLDLTYNSVLVDKKTIEVT